MEGQLTQVFFRILNKPQTYANIFQLIETVKTRKHRRGEEDKEVPYVQCFSVFGEFLQLGKKFKKVKKSENFVICMDFLPLLKWKK